jgi:hypothetical protein
VLLNEKYYDKDRFQKWNHLYLVLSCSESFAAVRKRKKIFLQRYPEYSGQYSNYAHSGISHFRAATSGHVTSIYFPAWRSVI